MLRAAWARGMGGFASHERGTRKLRNKSRLKPAGLGWQTETGVKPDAGKVLFLRVPGHRRRHILSGHFRMTPVKKQI